MKTKIKSLRITLITIGFACLCVSLTVSAQNVETLTNGKVIELYQKGLSASIITNKIKASKSNFDVSSDALINLKDQKIPDDIVNAMVEASGSSSAIKITDPNDPFSLHESGIYLELKTTQKELKEMEPTVTSQSKSNDAARILVSGLINSKNKVTIAGKAARLQIDSIQSNPPVFYFYFEPGGNSLNSSTVNSNFQNATSPNEFMLVHMNIKRNSREFTTGKANNFSSQSGIDDKQLALFDYEKLASGIYKVTPKQQLPVGEYCWMYAGHNTKDQGAKVYDFGIK